MSENFEFWNKQLNIEYDKVKRYIDIYLKKTIFPNFGIIVLGAENSGKTEFIQHVIDTLFYLNSNNDKIGKIIKISYDDFIQIKTLKTDEYDKSNKLVELINTSISVPISPLISIDVELGTLLSRILSKSKINIIWIENINKYGEISLDYLTKIIGENKLNNNIYIVSTRDPELSKKFKELFNNNTVQLCIPKLTLEWYEKSKRKSKNSQAYSKSLFKELNTRENVASLIQMGGETYGGLKSLLKLDKESINNISKKDYSDIYNQLFCLAVDNKNSIDVNDKETLLIKSFLLSEKGIDKEWLDSMFPDFSFDYMKYIDDWIDRGLIHKKNKKYKINSLFLKHKDFYLRNNENKRLCIYITEKINLFLKEESPENYKFRYLNAKKFDEELAEEYFFIYLLREPGSNVSNRLNTVSLSNGNVFLYNLLKTNHQNLTDIQRNQLLDKLKMAKNHCLPLLIYAEYSYFYLQVLLNYTCEEQGLIHSKIELQLQRLIRIFDNLIERNEDEMAIKIGLLLAPQIINHLTNRDRNEAMRIYKITTEKIYKRKQINYLYYKRYDIIAKCISTSLIEYRKASYNLFSVLESIYEKNFNFEELMPLVFCNLLGITLFLDYQSLEELNSYYYKHYVLLSFEKTNDPKILNNIMLAQTCLSECYIGEKNNTYLNKLQSVKDKSICKLNYAGYLFYTERFEAAKKILEEIMKNKKYDDFYQFYCKYNLYLIELLERNSNQRSVIVDKLEYLEIPSLFQDKNVEKLLTKRISILKKLAKNLPSVSAPKEADKFFLKNLDTGIPLFKFCWNFSDYQHWN